MRLVSIGQPTMTGDDVAGVLHVGDGLLVEAAAEVGDALALEAALVGAAFQVPDAGDGAGGDGGGAAPW